MQSFQLKNGTLDDFIYEKVRNKQSILCEVLCMKQTWKPFAHIINDINATTLSANILRSEQNMINYTILLPIQKADPYEKN